VEVAEAVADMYPSPGSPSRPDKFALPAEAAEAVAEAAWAAAWTAAAAAEAAARAAEAWEAERVWQESTLQLWFECLAK
jgi:hypothetical protein